MQTRRALGQEGFALLAVIVAMIVMAVTMTAVVPNFVMQAKREREIEMVFRGEHMAEAIARYYAGGKLSPAGLVVRTPPPPYGYLTELRKLRDGVTLGSSDLYLARRSAYIDPMTNDEWEPIRVGDPRLRKFFRAWQQSTGRQLPPIYASYLGAGNVLDTSENPPSSDGPGSSTNQNSNTAPDGGFDEDDDEDWDDEEEDDGEWDDEEGDDSEDGEEDEDVSSLGTSGAGIVNASYQLSPTPPAQLPARPSTSQRDPRSSGSPFGNGSTRLGPIIGVVTKAKGYAVRTRFGIEKYEEMLFVYIPPVRTGVPGQGQPPANAPGTNPARPPQGADNDGDAIPDNIEKPTPTQ